MHNNILSGSYIFEGYVIPENIMQLRYLNTNGHQCDQYHNIMLTPQFIDSTNGNFRLNPSSPCIDAGDPNLPLDPDMTIRDMGAIYYDQGGCRITLEPVNPPIVIPPGGGNFAFEAVIVNSHITPFTCDIWTEAVLANGHVFRPLLIRRDLSLNPLTVLTREIVQDVPANAPWGGYRYVGVVGIYPAVVVSSDTFDVLKMPGEEGGSSRAGWDYEGWDDERNHDCIDSVIGNIPFTASPNPFNPATVVSFELRDADFIKLAVFDITGRETARLAEGSYSAGEHKVEWEASAAPSGIYFARLTAGDLKMTRKILLVK